MRFAKNVQTNFDSAGSAIGGLVGRLGGLYLGFQGLSKAIGAVDSYTKFNAQLTNATKSTQELAQAQANVSAIATKAQVDIGALGSTYARISNALKDTGATQKQVSDITETLSLALKANGASVNESSSALLQLSQAFGKGKLDGDEFRTAMEAAPNVMRALAASMGVPFGALKDLAKEGKITNEVMLKAFTDPALLKALNEQAEKTRTIGGEWEVFTNQLTLTIGKINEATGASKFLIAELSGAVNLLKILDGSNSKPLRDFSTTSVESLRNLAGGRFGNSEARAELERRAKLIEDTFAAAQAKFNAANPVYKTRIARGSVASYLGAPNLGARFDKKGKLIPLRPEGQGGYDPRLNEDIAKKSPTAAKQISDYEKLTRSINEKIAANKQELAIGTPLSESEKLLAQMTQQRADGTIKLSNAQFANVKASLEKLAIGDKELIQLKEQEKFYADFEASIEASNQAIYDQIDAIGKQSSDLEFQNEVFGKLPSAITEVTIARLNDKKATLDGLGLAVGDIEDQIKAYDRLRAAQNNDEFLKAEKQRIDDIQKAQTDALKETAQEAKRMAESINQSITDALLRGFESGKGFAKNFRDTLINMFKTLVLRPIVSFLVDSSGIAKLLGGLAGGGSSSALAAGSNVLTGTGSNSIFGKLSGIKDLFSSNDNFITKGIEGLGSFIANGDNVFGRAIGGFLGENAAGIANGFAYLGAGLQALKGNFAGAALTAVGTFFGGPIGGAIGGIIGGLFGGKRGKGDAAEGIFKNGKYATSRIYSGDKGGSLGIGGNLDEVNKQFTTSLAGVLSAFGVAQEISANAWFGAKKREKGFFFGSVGDKKFSSGAGFTEYDSGTGWKKFTDNVFGPVFIQALQASALPAGIKKFFNGLTDIAAVNDVVTSLVGMQKALVYLPPVFKSVQDAINSTTTSVSIADLKARFSAIGTYTDLFYSDQEKFSIFSKSVGLQFDALNTSLPKTRDEFRKLVDGSTGALFDGLVAIAPAADAYYKSLQAQEQQLDANAAALAESIGTLRDASTFSSRLDFQRYQGVAQNYGATFAADYSSNVEAGRISVGDDGIARVANSGNTNIVQAISLLRTTNEAQVVSLSKILDELRKYFLFGLPVKVLP